MSKARVVSLFVYGLLPNLVKLPNYSKANDVGLIDQFM